MANNENTSTMRWKVDIADLKNSMGEAKKSIAMANAEFKTATAGMDGWAKSGTGLEAKLKQLNTVLPAQKTQLAALEKQYEIVAREQGENSAEAEKLKLQIEKQKAVVAKTEAEVKKYSTQLEAAKKAEAEAESTTSKLSKKIEDQKKAVADNEKAYKEAVLTYGKNSKEVKELAKEHEQLTKDLDKSEKEMKDADKATDELTGSEKDLEKQTKDTGSAAEKAGEFFGGFAKTVGTAAVAATAAFASAVAGATKALADCTVEAGKYADNMLTMSKTTGISAEDLQAYNYMAELTDVSLETMSAAVKKNTKAMISAKDGTGVAAEAYKALGISVTDANGNLRDSDTVMFEALDALGQISNETERDAMAMQLFGRSATDLNPIIMAGSEKLQELKEEAQNVGAVMSGDQLASLGQFDDTMQRLSAGADAAKNSIGLVLLPVLQELADDGTELIGEFSKSMLDANGDVSQVAAGLGNLIKKVAGKILERLPEIVEVGAEILGSLAGALIDNLPIILDTATALIDKFAEQFEENLPAILSAGMTIVKALGGALLQNLPTIIQCGMTIIMELARELIKNLPEIIKVGMEILVQLIQGLTEALPELIAMLPEIIETVVTTLLDNLPLIIDAGIELLLALVEGIIEAIPQLIEMLPEIIEKIFTTLVENLPKILQAGAKLIGMLIQGIWNALGSLGRAAGQIFSKIWDAVKALPDKMKELGGNILGGIWQGLQDAWNWLTEKVSGLFGGLIDFVKGLFGIHSPSKVMADEVGKFLPSGISEGFKKGMPAAMAEMKKSLSGAVSGLQTTVDLKAGGVLSASASGGAAYGAAVAGGTSVNFVQNNYSPKALSALDIYKATNEQLFSAKVRRAYV